ncbi:hypothetical protein HYW35_00835 [Candidatus Saccharibacteria bacterium]|nr:hypothetical protein [Candidatus Saccharibacteria bacterium]
MKKTNQQGFTFFVVVILAGVLAIIVLAGWNIYQRGQKNEAVSSSVGASAIKAVPLAPALSTASDLDKAAQILDQTVLDSDYDTAQLDQDLASF